MLWEFIQVFYLGVKMRFPIIYKELTEKEKLKRCKQFQRMIKDKNIQSIKKEGKQVIITYQNKQIFKCSGWLIDNSVIIQFSKRRGIFY